MPIYEYRCRACGHEFEYLLLPKGPAPSCVRCRSGDLEKLISAFMVSSEHTRERSMRGAREKAKARKFEEQHEHHKRLHAEHD